MMMGETWAAFGSSMASLFFFWATLQQILPYHFRIAIQEFLLSAIQQLSFIQKFSEKIVNVFSPYVEVSFPELVDYMDYRFNHAFAAIETYLGAKAIKKANHVKASQVKESRGLVLRRDEKKVRDEYRGANVWWDFVIDSDGIRSLRLTFHKREWDIISGSYLEYVLEEGKSIEARNKKTKLFTNNPSNLWESGRWNFWRSIDFEHPASFETLAMDPKKKDEILNDLMVFRNSKEYYKKVGKAWKRGYLLHGPPGTGKSTLIAAMANLLNYNVYDIELTAIRNNLELRKLLIATKSKSIIVIEDIDCSLDLTGKRIKKKESDWRDKNEKAVKLSRPLNFIDEENISENTVTLSGLLNFIDGIWSACGQERIILFTTNHLEKLDPALIRRGRMDVHIEMSYCTFEAFKILAKNYLNLDSHSSFEKIESLLKETKITPADVAESLMVKDHNTETDPTLENLIRTLEKLKKDQRIKRNEIEKINRRKPKKFRKILNLFSP